MTMAWLKSRSRQARIFMMLCGVALVAMMLFVFRGWFFGPRWPPSPQALLNHKQFSWRTHETADFWIHYEAGSFAERDLALLTKLHAVAMPGLLELIGESAYFRKIHIFAVESRARMKALIGLEGNGKAFPEHDTMLCVFSGQTKAGGAHELMHMISNKRWGTVPFKDRIWLDEGLACYAEDKCYIQHKPWRRDMHIQSKRLSASRRLVPLEQLTGGFTNWTALSTEVSYPQAGSFVRFLYERHGREKLKALWQAPRPEFHRIYGKTLAELEAEWLAVLERTDDNESKPAGE